MTRPKRSSPSASIRSPASPPPMSPRSSDALKLDGAAREDAKPVFPTLYKAFTEKDMSLLEVNPLIVMKDGHLGCSTPR